jgi:raffinose/stachyose/melibiose transport system substrate-binding protein
MALSLKNSWRREKMKKVFSVLLIFMVCGVLAIYAGGTSDKSAAGGKTDKVVIQIFHYMLQVTKQEGLLEVEEAFTKKYPNVSFENIFYNQGIDYFPQLSTALASGQQPNIIMGNPGLYPDVISNGYAMNLTNNEVIKNLKLPSGDLGDVSANKVVYGFPIDFKTWGVFYNVDIFNKLGIKVPTKQSELLEACRKITAAGIDPWAHCYSDAVMGDIEMRNTVWTRAITAGDKDLFENLMNGKKKLTDYPYFEEGLKVWRERMQGARKDAIANSQDKALEIFLSGQAAMLYMGSWSIGDLVAKIGTGNFKFDFFIAPIDENPQSQKLNVQVDQAFMVNPKAKNADIALKFMEFWITDGALAWSEATMLPLTTGQVSDKLLSVVKTLSAIKETGNIAHYGDFTMPFNTEFTTAYRRGLNAFAESAVTGGTMTPAQCLANIQAAFDNVRATSK